MIKGLHLKRSRGHVSGGKEQESGAHNLGKEQLKNGPDHLDWNHHSPQEDVVRKDPMWPPACNLGQEIESNGRSGQDHKNGCKNGKDYFCWSSTFQAVAKKEPPLLGTRINLAAAQVHQVVKKNIRVSMRPLIALRMRKLF